MQVKKMLQDNANALRATLTNATTRDHQPPLGYVLYSLDTVFVLAHAEGQLEGEAGYGRS